MDLKFARKAVSIGEEKSPDVLEGAKTPWPRGKGGRRALGGYLGRVQGVDCMGVGAARHDNVTGCESWNTWPRGNTRRRLVAAWGCKTSAG